METYNQIFMHHLLWLSIRQTTPDHLKIKIKFYYKLFFIYSFQDTPNVCVYVWQLKALKRSVTHT